MGKTFEKVFPTPLSKLFTHCYIGNYGMFVPLSVGGDVLDAPWKHAVPVVIVWYQ